MPESKKYIPLSVPNFEGNEKKYVNEAVETEWVSTGGAFITKMEGQLAAYRSRESCKVPVRHTSLHRL